MNKQLTHRPFRFTLINFLSLPGILVLPYLIALLIATKGMTGDNAIGTALKVFEVFLYTAPLLLLGWTFWVYRRLKPFSFNATFKSINWVILALPYGVLLLVGGYFGGKAAYSWYEHGQILESRTVETYRLPDTLSSSHFIGAMSASQQKLYLFPDSGLAASVPDSAKRTCLVQYAWKDGGQRPDTQFFAGQHMLSYKLKKGQVFGKPLAQAQWLPEAEKCLTFGKQRSKPAYTGLSRYGSQNGEDQFEAYAAGVDRVEHVLPGFKPFDYQILSDLITDKAARHWFAMRKADALFVGFIKSDAQNKVFELKSDYKLPSDPQEPAVKGLAVKDERVWLHTRKRVFHFTI